MYNLEYLAYMTRQQRGALLDTVKPRHCDGHELPNHDNDNEELDDSEGEATTLHRPKPSVRSENRAHVLHASFYEICMSYYSGAHCLVCTLTHHHTRMSIINSANYGIDKSQLL